MNKSSNKLICMGLFTAIAASLCCITPVLALIAGASGMASTFSWLEPARPYLIGVAILVIGFAWFQKLKPRKEINCDCETDENSSFWQSKKFLGIITIFAALMLSFPHYSGMFFPDSESKTIIIKESSLSEVILTIEGMTCTGCEHSVNHALSSLEGVLESRVSFESGKAIVQFDKTKLNPDQLSHTIEKETGYKVINIETQE